MSRANGILRDTAFTLDCLADYRECPEDMITYSNGYWDSVEHCRSNAKPNADYIRDFIEDTLIIDDDMQVFILEQLARIVEWYRTKDHR